MTTFEITIIVLLVAIVMLLIAITNGENHGVIVVDKTFDVDNSGRELHWTYRCLEPNGNEFVIDKKDEDKWELQTED